MKNKGFTLVELLSVIVILGVLLAIAIPSVDSYIKKTRKEYYETLEKNVSLAAQDYVNDHRNEINNIAVGGSKILISTNNKALSVLETEKYIDEITDSNGVRCDKIKVSVYKKAKNNYEYTTTLCCDSYRTNDDACK